MATGTGADAFVPAVESTWRGTRSTAPPLVSAEELSNPLSPLGAKMENVTDPLIAEGYLKKIRGFGRNRQRWFRLTAHYFAFYTDDGGELIAYVPRELITDVCNLTTTRFSITTSAPFGSSGLSSMILEARSAEVKTKWLRALDFVGEGGSVVRPLIEGFLTKLQVFGSLSRTRWFVLNAEYLAYYSTECAELLGRCPVKQITHVSARGEASFVLKAAEPFTRTGANILLCQCSSPQQREKWLAVMNRVVGRDRVRQQEFTPLSQQTRRPEDSFAVLTKQQWIYTGENSEGNRFISDNNL